MVEYQYDGVNRSGKRVSGKVDAPTEGELRMILRAQGIRPTKVSKVGALNMDLGALFTKGVGSVPLEVLVTFTRQLQVLTGSGIPLVQGLEILTDQATGVIFKNVIISIREKVSQGSYLWEALGAYPKIFPKLYVALIRAGEASGSMDSMLKRLSKYLEDSDRIRKLVKSTMMYPIIVTVIGIGVVAMMLIFVIPKFEAMLNNSGQELPLPTAIIIDVSHFLINNIWYILVALGVSIYVLNRYFKSDEGKAVKDRILFRLPLFGDMLQKSGVARFSRDNADVAFVRGQSY